MASHHNCRVILRNKVTGLYWHGKDWREQKRSLLFDSMYEVWRACDRLNAEIESSKAVEKKGAGRQQGQKISIKIQDKSESTGQLKKTVQEYKDVAFR